MSERENTLEVLRKTRSLLSDPEKWGKGWYKNPLGDQPCYCMAGAIRACGGDLRSFDEADVVLRELKASTSFNHVPTFNDDKSTAYADILAFLDRCIARAERELGLETHPTSQGGEP